MGPKTTLSELVSSAVPRRRARCLTARRFRVESAAGAERRSTPRVFGSAFRHLQDAQAKLRGRPQRQPVRLGRMFHVGEDVGDLMTGLRHLDEAASLLLPRGDGGRLGHAPALSDDPGRIYQRRGGQIEPVLGTPLLDLVRARTGLREGGLGGDRRRVARRIRELSGTTDVRIPECSRKMGLAPIHHGRPLAEVDAPDPDGSILRDDELLAVLYGRSELGEMDGDLPGRLTRRLTVTADPCWLELTGELQELLRGRLARRRLCLEANPTSNLLIGGFADYREIPYRSLTDAGLAVSSSTGDPGLSMASLPRGFAAMYPPLSLEMRHREALQWPIERLVDADQSTFLGTQVPAGRTAYQQAGVALRWPAGMPGAR